jgi:hypothetical protein
VSATQALWLQHMLPFLAAQVKVKVKNRTSLSSWASGLRSARPQSRAALRCRRHLQRADLSSVGMQDAGGKPLGHVYSLQQASHLVGSRCGCVC